jgi:quercetin dioxygenase-like cupin family protein
MEWIKFKDSYPDDNKFFITKSWYDGPIYEIFIKFGKDGYYDGCLEETEITNDLFIDDKTQHPNQLVMARTRKTTPEIVPKGWGHEVIFVNNTLYCGKILHFKKSARFSMHYHLKKKETWYVASGKFQFKYIDTRTADILETTLETGDTITNEVGEPHQIICLEEGDIFEVSTTHHDDDSYRIIKGDSQQ